MIINTSEQQFEVWWRIHNTPSMQAQKEQFRRAFLAGYDYSALAGWALRTNQITRDTEDGPGFRG